MPSLNTNYLNRETLLPELEERDFLLNVQQQILALLRKNDFTLSQLLSQLSNCDPLVVKEAIDYLISSEFIDFKYPSGQYRCKNLSSFRLSGPKGDILNKYENKDVLTKLPPPVIRKSNEIIQAIKESLPEASPVYFQWWFNDPSFPLLSNAISSRISSSSNIAFMGSPTLGTYFANLNKNYLSILDIDKTLLKNLKKLADNKAEFIHYDVADDIDEGYKNKFDIVYLDPPWNLSHILLFLKRASDLCREEGNIFISLPPDNTRSTIRQEREKIHKFMRECQLEILSYWPSCIKYDVPPFERKAYLQSGIKLNKPWRQGDLLLLKKNKKIVNISLSISPPEQNKWTEFVIDNRRLFFQEKSQFSNNVPLIAKPDNYNNFYLKTTSYRETARKNVNMISSQNHGASVQGGRIVCEILDSLSHKCGFEKTKQEFVMRYRSYEKQIDETIKTLFSFVRD